ncbi:MAG: hypothetical protein EZS28_056542, partial [Streblomastix strix]
LKGIPAELIIQGDEVGYSQYCDSRLSERHISIMAAASLSGDYVLPFVIVRAPLRLEEHLKVGTRQGVDAYLVESTRTTMTGDLFAEWMLKCLVPFLNKNRQLNRLMRRQMNKNKLKSNPNPKVTLMYSTKYFLNVSLKLM